MLLKTNRIQATNSLLEETFGQKTHFKQLMQWWTQVVQKISATILKNGEPIINHLCVGWRKSKMKN